ncbi:Bug family tripartite tricarboxylate transporter substrate binding protein [Alteribacillus iranensis]|uniref:Tripartite-type tricarboxylate transporter, receptor component TctC n=1 Tax=Alteribacillus iranensis TaxID=930128 RepID=A0A1I2BIT3_9BACI|nr:tripartite tricarboxylate transporter substrate binding protein [Alteribacillus iranensis]SFE55738.1 Tripartite-type tricarboxylate transporter, receptor component TctC [Alteribacillus iranensis]
MKKFISLLLFILLVFVSVACGGANEEGEASTSDSGENSENAAEGYPDGPIEIIVGFGEGGGTDTMARMLQPIFQEELGVNVAVRNMPGASSALALEHVAEQPADGQTILFQTDLLRVFPTMGMTDLTYKDFEQVGVGTMGIANFVVSPDSELETFDDIVSLLQEGDATIGVAGVGDPWHLTAEIVNSVVEGESEIITYESGSNAAMATLRGEVDFSISGVNEVVDLLQSGEAESLAVMDKEGFEVPDYGTIPPVTDFVEELEAYAPEGTWWGPAVKAGTPEPIVEKLREVYNKALQSEEFKKFAEEGAIVMIDVDDPQEYTKETTEITSWLLWDIGTGKRSPEEVGIQRPE